MKTLEVELEEVELCGVLVAVTALVDVALVGREFAECEGHGRVCTFGGSATVVSAVPVIVTDVNGERELTAAELSAFDQAFWCWLTADREQWLQELAWGV